MSMLPYLIGNQLPEYVVSEYPAFVDFLKAYYEWLSSHGNLDIEAAIDVDTTSDNFIKHFKQQLDVNGVFNTIDNKLYLKHIKELYATRGSANAYNFLFKILFNKAATVTSPWDSVFRPSQGQWSQDISILVDIESGLLSDVVGNVVDITDVAGNIYKTHIINGISRSNEVAELFLKRFTHQQELSTVTTSTGFSASVLKTPVRVKVEKGGAGFSVGQIFAINSYGGSDTVIKVKSVSDKGAILSAEIFSFGTGYSTDFTTVLGPSQSINSLDLGSSIQLKTKHYVVDSNGSYISTGDDGVTRHYRYVGEDPTVTHKTNDNASPQHETGSLVKHDYINTDGSYLQDYTYVGQTVGEFRTQGGIVAAGEEGAVLTFVLGQLCAYPGHYIKNDSILGDGIYIQDSDFYQLFSYVTEVEETLVVYRDVLRKVLHPAGTRHYGKYLVNNKFNLSMTAVPTLNMITLKDIIRDFAYFADFTFYHMEKALFTTATAAEFKWYHFTAPKTDTSTATDFWRFWDTIAKFDTATSADAIAKHTTAPKTDSVGVKYVPKTYIMALGKFDTVNTPEYIAKHVVAPKTDTAKADDPIAKWTTAPKTDTTSSSDFEYYDATLNKADTSSAAETQRYYDATLNKADTSSAADFWKYSDTISKADTSSAADFWKYSDTISKADTSSAADIIKKFESELGKSDTVKIPDVPQIIWNRYDTSKIGDIPQIIWNRYDTAKIGDVPQRIWNRYDTAKVTDAPSRLWNRADTVTFSDTSIRFEQGYQVNETISIRDVFSRSGSRPFADSTGISDSSRSLTAKYNSDTATAQTTGYINVSPYYYDVPDGIIYWDIGYLVGEQVLQN